LPSVPATGKEYKSIHTFCVAGTRNVGTFTFWPCHRHI
jgi:hypothetical protein